MVNVVNHVMLSETNLVKWNLV